MFRCNLARLRKRTFIKPKMVRGAGLAKGVAVRGGERHPLGKLRSAETRALPLDSCR